MREFLRQIPLFSDLAEDDLVRLCKGIDEIRLPIGKVLFKEGNLGEKAYVIQEGELEVFKIVGHKEVLLDILASGEVVGELALLQNRPRTATVRARKDCILLVIDQEQLTHLVHTSPTAAETMFYTVLSRWQASEAELRQSEKMAQLGTLTAGIAHELNNPAAAVKRAVEQLETAMNNMAEYFGQLARYEFNDSQKALMQRFTEKARLQANHPRNLDALARSDQECVLEDWFDEHQIDDGWELAPTLVNIDINQSELKVLEDTFDTRPLTIVLCWLNANYETYNLLAELRLGVGNISEIVKGLKAYSYLDQAPVQNVNIHDGLDNSLLILRHKIGSGISVRQEYCSNMPLIHGYGSELNQVWTNIIDNAVDAVGEKGIIIVRTRYQDNWAVVEIEDDGPGIPDDIQARVFESFFTTKPPGAGTGLGLDISYRIVANKHRGDIKVFSQPGRTRFEVWLPIEES